MVKPDISFRREGAKVIMKQVIPDRELTPVEILNAIEATEQKIEGIKQQMAEAEKSIENGKGMLENEKSLLHELKKHHEWATDVQQSAIKAVVDEISEECRNRVDSTYKHDGALDDEANARQKFVQYRHFIATHEKMRERIGTNVMKEFVYGGSLKNPWL